MSPKEQTVEYKLRITAPRPYFAELPYYLWGEVNYDSDGDCKRPTDTEWHDLDLTNRGTHENVQIFEKGGVFTVRSKSRALAARMVYFLHERSGAAFLEGDPRGELGDWDHDAALKRTLRVREEFARAELKPFDSKLFWGSWKWVGWFATDFTWVGRWIMDSVLKRDTRAVCLCVDWLKQGTFNEEQSKALRYALNYLTGESYSSDQQWVKWYYSGPGSQRYPEPDFKAWHEELKGS
jgi:hypothetical protein